MAIDQEKARTDLAEIQRQLELAIENANIAEGKLRLILNRQQMAQLGQPRVGTPPGGDAGFRGGLLSFPQSPAGSPQYESQRIWSSSRTVGPIRAPPNFSPIPFPQSPTQRPNLPYYCPTPPPGNSPVYANASMSPPQSPLNRQVRAGSPYSSNVSGGNLSGYSYMSQPASFQQVGDNDLRQAHNAAFNSAVSVGDDLVCRDLGGTP